MKKKILAIIGICTLVLGGCGSAATEENKDVAASETELSVTEEVKDEAGTEEVTENDTEKENEELEAARAIWMDADRSPEERAEALLSVMTVEEKAFQMVEPEQANITADDVRTYGVGSVLSGGGSAPSTGNTLDDWYARVGELKAAALETRLQIPIIYGVDAVHGNNNVYGATIFPHNIGLGAADDEELMKEIARVTAEEVKAMGVQWDFSPCLGNPQDVTWGRTYECYSEETETISRLAAAYISGLEENGVAACAKHYIGEGYTADGENKGNVDMTEEEFDELLSEGVLDPYTAAVNAGVLTVMPSYNSINGVRCHENYHLLTEVLKEQLGFKGFVISDYNAIEQVSGNTLKDKVCVSVNAGVDMLMQVSTWKECAQYIVELNEEGRISNERLDDAVSRILYVKFAEGLFDEESDEEEHEALVAAYGSDEHREVARQAVRESLVLLKNDNDALDKLKEASFVTVEGSAAYDIGRQCGGWTISWQGMSGKTTLGTTFIEGFYSAVKDHATVKHSVDGSFDTENTNAIVAVFGEMPYAESDGDRDTTVEIAAVDTEMLDSLKENLKAADSDIPVIGVVYTGRPIDISEYEDMFDCIVVAWLPGTEGEGISDVLVGDYDFTGTLKYTWDMGGSFYEYGSGLKKN